MNKWEYFWRVGKEMEKVPFWTRFFIALAIVLGILLLLIAGEMD